MKRLFKEAGKSDAKTNKDHFRSGQQVQDVLSIQEDETKTKSKFKEVA